MSCPSFAVILLVVQIWTEIEVAKGLALPDPLLGAQPASHVGQVFGGKDEYRAVVILSHSGYICILSLDRISSIDGHIYFHPSPCFYLAGKSCSEMHELHS